MITTETKLTGDLSGALDRFAKNVQESVTFSGVAAMAKVIYDAARENAPVSDGAHWFHGTHQKYYFESGTLKASIYRVYSSERSSAERKTYKVSWNHQKAPYGFMVEFGTSRAPAHPFMRPAFDRIGEAIKAGQARMAERLSELKVES
jgi:HK97 gp10 family phage protein